MKLPGYYSSGEFAKKAHITKKTVRYYDEHNILKPSYVNENGARFYNDDDFARLQQILFLKYLGFSLDDIKEMTLRNTDSNVMSESLHMQLGLSLIHISEPTRRTPISYAVFCLKKKKKDEKKKTK